MPASIYFEIAFVVVFTTFVAYLLNSSALKRLSPTTVSIYIYLQPVLASLFAVFWGADSVDMQKTLAAFLIFTGVYLVSTGSLKKETLNFHKFVKILRNVTIYDRLWKSRS